MTFIAGGVAAFCRYCQIGSQEPPVIAMLPGASYPPVVALGTWLSTIVLEVPDETRFGTNRASVASR
ncbi:hypothetical protein [Nonomuraea basaltis]|uniref:hypothetical protein n=1 Tax=Nonomuraea basaltis TaxID=2495887 RepID=UPI00110C5336|nr:hypothetical protein [Nonomuraea basaltis]TMR93329.1 hypothetical protein EJK15_39905 [Nonomuraea basaltis]